MADSVPTSNHPECLLPADRKRLTEDAHDDGVLVREICASEVERVRCLACHHSFSDAAAPRRFDLPPSDAGNPVAWIAEADDRVAGIVFGWECFGTIAHICQVRVHAQYHGHDIARHLARAALESAREHGCLKVVLHNRACPKEVLEIVEGLGFVFGRRRDCQGDACLEFYLDLYTRPSAPTEVDRSKEGATAS